MLRTLKNKDAQAVMGEYVLVIFLVMAVLIGMTAYFKRSMQARIHDARYYMVNEVRERTADVYVGNLYKEYEPYYGNTVANVSRSIADETRVEPGASSGIFRKSYNEAVSVWVNSQTAPPRDFERTTPVN
ncbi:MAG: hypothetical protein KAR31_00915 [Candidatus Omnitrophica bacterium]|nr:hypothetical protein [Candidatus Omnitrophota bacterium]